MHTKRKSVCCLLQVHGRSTKWSTLAAAERVKQCIWQLHREQDSVHIPNAAQMHTMHILMCCFAQVYGETVKLGIPGAAQRMEASAKVMIPLQRVGTPEDAAGAMLMLASPYASYISAQVGFLLLSGAVLETLVDQTQSKSEVDTISDNALYPMHAMYNMF